MCCRLTYCYIPLQAGLFLEESSNPRGPSQSIGKTGWHLNCHKNKGRGN